MTKLLVSLAQDYNTECLQIISEDVEVHSHPESYRYIVRCSVALEILFFTNCLHEMFLGDGSCYLTLHYSIGVRKSMGAL